MGAEATTRAEPAVPAAQGDSRPGELRTPEFRPDIQGLRAVAVGLVVLSHAHIAGFSGGFVGVDVFFVISGFLITGLLLKDAGRGSVGFARFYSRRALRILPAATLVIVVTAVASMVVLNAVRAKQVLVDSVWASLFAANVKFSRDGTDYFSDTTVSPLQHFWSLAVEEQFYLIWPAVLALTVFGLPLLLIRFGAPSRTPGPGTVPRRRIAVVLAAVGAVSLVASIRDTAAEPTAAYFSTIDRTWELAAGALLATCLPMVRRLPQQVRALLAWTGIAGITVAAINYDEGTPFPGIAALLPVLGAVAVLAGGVGAPRWGAHQVLGRQPMRYLGDISYSLYLWHWPVLILAAQYTGEELTPAQTLLMVGLAVLLSVVSYHWVENPFRRSRKRWGSRTTGPLLLWPVTVGAVVVLAVVGVNHGPTLTSAAAPAAPSTKTAGPDEIKDAVLAARRSAPVPGNLQPALELIGADETSIGDCSAYHQTQSRICQFGDPKGTRTMVLFGNSHSIAWVPGLQKAAKAAGWQLFPIVKPACDFPAFHNDETNECRAWYTWAVQQVAAQHPDLIVMGAYTTGDWVPALAAIVDELKPLTTRMMVLSDVPGAPKDPLDCLAARGATLHNCSFELMPSKNDDDDELRAITTRAGVEYRAIYDWFCYENECPTVIGNRVVYADHSHITATYSTHLASRLGPALHL